MPITEILQKNADFYPNDISLVEINPQLENRSRMTWREYSLIEANPNEAYRKEITWGEFNSVQTALLIYCSQGALKRAIRLPSCL